MSETQSDGNVNVMGTTSEVLAGDENGLSPGIDSFDKALKAIWDKHNGPAAELKNPAMPADFAASNGDHFKAAWEWNQLSLKDRQESAAVHREFADLKKQGEALGMKTESAADMKAIQDMLAGDKGKAEAPAAIDQETQASLDTYKTIVPFAKDHVEARNHLSKLAEHVQRDPKGGSRAVLEHLGISTPLDLLTPQEWQQAREYLLGPQAAPQQAEPAVAPYLDKWARQSGATKQDMAAMADIMSDPSWREIAGESDKSVLDRAYKATKRQSSHGRMNAKLDAELRATAADIYRP